MFELERYLFVKNKTKIIEFQIYRKFVHIMKGGGRKFIRNHISFLRKLKHLKKKRKITIKFRAKRLTIQINAYS